MDPSPPVLWQYSFSNYNEKARWALDFKGVAHRRRSLLPSSPRALAFSRSGGTLPVLDLGSERVTDSTAIIAALERTHPEPPLYPADADERRHALELEEFFDENAGHDVRRVAFWEVRDAPAFVAAYVSTDRGPLARLGMRLTMPVGWQYVKRRYGFSEESYERSREKLTEALERIESERRGGDHLVGERFSVADLTAAALFFPLVMPAELQYDYPDAPRSELRESLDAHPAVAWIRDIYRRHRGRSAEA